MIALAVYNEVLITDLSYIENFVYIKILVNMLFSWKHVFAFSWESPERILLRKLSVTKTSFIKYTARLNMDKRVLLYINQVKKS